ncbi:phage tail length tape measure family protein [Burkholderia orbicola]|uniref:phage tail length tape measure family protein n=1 Tax=Burkholderia orbicola TaxID=2978683 RepID=UPI00264ED6DB|nr:phage tail length tape measure family protein [Burkholderia orbicola]MDN7533869.1 phage tail length tape measure family protein [Burkholderia orbicola]
MTSELSVALRVQPKLDDARRALSELKRELNDLRQSAQSTTAAVSSTGSPTASTSTTDPNGAAANQTASASAAATTALQQQSQAAGQAAQAATKHAAATQVAATQSTALTTQAQQQTQATTAAAAATDREREAIQRLIAQLDPAAGAAQRLAAAEKELNTALSKGLITVDQHNRLMAQAQKQLGGTGVSAGQTAMAMRQLPAQITDIVTSLSSGMPVWMVAIQQGGQIRDSFGGFGAALRGVFSLITPVTAAIAVIGGTVGAFVLSVYKGEQQLMAFNIALQSTGNAAGATLGRIESVAKAAHDVSGISEVAAQSAAIAMVQTGRLGIETIGNLTKAISGYAETTGQDTDKAAASLARMFVDPKQAIKELDDQFNLLTPAQRAYINQLIEQGQTEQAQLQISEALAQRFGKLLPENLGVLQRALKGISDAAKEAVGWMMSLGKQSSLDQQIKDSQARITELTSRSTSPTMSALFGTDKALADEQTKLASLKQKKADEDKAADEAEAKASTDRHIKALKEDFDAQKKTYDTAREKIADEKKKLDELLAAGPAGGGISQAEYNARLKAVTDRANRGQGGNAGAIAAAQAKADLETLRKTFQESDALIVKALEDGRMSINEAYQKRIDAFHAENAAERQVLEAELANPKTTKPRRIELQAQIKGLDAALADGDRKTTEWKRSQELKLANLVVKIRIDTANLTGKFDRDAIEQQLQRQYADDVKGSFGLTDPAEVIAAQQNAAMIAQAGLAQAEFNAKLEEAARLQAQLGVIEQSYQQRAASGQISQIEAEAQINHARAAQIPVLQAIVQELERIKGAMPVDAAAAIDKMSNSVGALQNQVAAATPVVVDLGTRLKNTLVDGAADAAASAVQNFENLGQAASTVLKQIAADIVRSDIKRLLTNLFTPDSGSGGATFFGSIIGGVKSIFGFAKGGLIRGPGTGTSDSIPALVGGARPIAVSDGEFIQNERAVQHYGLPFMEAVRTLRLPKPAFAFGGLVSATRAASRFATGGAVSSAAPSTASTPSTRVELVNQDTPKRAVSAESYFDGKDTVTRIVLADANTNGPMTRALKGAISRS